MYAAITTRFIGPSNTLGKRLVASAGDGRRLIVHWDHALNPEGNHRAAALALRDKLDWTGDLIGGWNDGTGLWVFADTPYKPEPPQCSYPGCTIGIHTGQHTGTYAP